MAKVRKAKYLYQDGVYYEIGGDESALDGLEAEIDEVREIAQSKADKSVSFTATLASASWSNDSQDITDSRFAASGYAYIVSPASSSFAAYGEAGIYADNVSTDGEITFHCSSAPSSDILVNITRVVVT